MTAIHDPSLDAYVVSPDEQRRRAATIRDRLFRRPRSIGAEPIKPKPAPAASPKTALKAHVEPITARAPSCFIPFLGIQAYRGTAAGPCVSNYTPSVKQIISSVADFYGVKDVEILGPVRTKKVVWPRHVAVYLSRELTGRSYPDIARRIGGRDHTTLVSANRRVVDRIAHDAPFRTEIDAIKKAIRNEYVQNAVWRLVKGEKNLALYQFNTVDSGSNEGALDVEDALESKANGRPATHETTVLVNNAC